MKRRDFLKSATFVAGANAASALPIAPQNQPAPETGKGKPLGKIALEEHFLLPDFVEYFAETYPNISPEIRKLGLGVLPDLGDQRIAVMDRNRIDFVVLSLAGPGVQVEKDAAVALRKAKSANDFLANEIQKRPARYGGFAHLSLHNPLAAADELERCMRDLNFQGAIINGQTNGEYLDLDKYSVFWERAAALEQPEPGEKPPLRHRPLHRSPDCRRPDRVYSRPVVRRAEDSDGTPIYFFRAWPRYRH